MLCRLPVEGLHYIAVEGPIGVGKSSLAKMLAEDLSARLILEDAMGNPFLSAFYSDPDQYAFQVQLFFLLSRYRQQIELKQQHLFNQVTVSDYVFAKDQIFASMNLTNDEMDLYNDVYNLLDSRLPKPDVVIFLQADPDTLISRVKKRKVPFEKGIQFEYIENLSQAYSQYFFRYNESPVLFVNTNGLDFVKKKKDYDTLKKELYHMLKTGKDKHYVTIDSR